MTQPVTVWPEALPHRAEGPEAVEELARRLRACGIPVTVEELEGSRAVTFTCDQRQLAVLCAEHVPVEFDPWVLTGAVEDSAKLPAHWRTALRLAVETAPDLEPADWGGPLPRVRDDPEAGGVWCAVWKLFPYQTLP